ncbi:13170_t:CDS:2, partial [Ambispora gerdemannii]
IVTLVLKYLQIKDTDDEMPALLFDWNQAGFNDTKVPNCRNGVAGQTQGAIITNILANGATDFRNLNLLFIFRDGQAIGDWHSNVAVNLPWAKRQAGVPDICNNILRLNKITAHTAKVDVENFIALEQYPDLYYEFSSENIDYYGITAEILCPLCKLDHDDEEDVEDTQVKSDELLTPEYLNWYSKLTDLPTTISDKLRSKLYKIYKKKIGLDPWIKSEIFESSQIKKDASNHLSRDYIIKISKFSEEKKAKCPVCKEIHTRRVIIAIQSLLKTQVKVSNKISNSPIHPNKTHLYQPEAGLCQYTIEHKMDPEKFSIITEAEKNRWVVGCFPADLERDICLYHGGIKRNEDTRKYHKFLTDQDRMVGEELLRCGLLKSNLSTAWLDDLIKNGKKSILNSYKFLVRHS